MASAQVLKKQGHLEAGKKKLEEFRRKKAAEKAKKASSNSQPHASNVPHESQPSETERARITDSGGVGTSDAPAEDHLYPSSETERARITDSGGVGTSDAPAEDHLYPSDVALNIASREPDILIRSDFSSYVDINAEPSLSEKNTDINSSVLERSYSKNDDYKGIVASIDSDGFRNAKNDFQSRKHDVGSSSQVAYGSGNDHSLSHPVSSSQEACTPSPFTYHGFDSYSSNNAVNNLSPGNSGSPAILTSDILPKNSVSAPLLDKLGNSGHEVNNLTSSPYQGAIGYMGTTNNSSLWTSENRYPDYHSDARSSSSHAPASPPASGRRSRPSFLDSIQIPKGSSPSPAPFGAEKADKLNSNAYSVDGLGSSFAQQLGSTSVASGGGVGLYNNAIENKHDFFSQKQNEDFAALEQHIEDLTQEKFSLQRALEASRSLAESLASENSALTDSFNRQGGVVYQLKLDLENLHEEIKGQLAELEAVRIEYANAQMECSAADERAKLLAAEVIGLEEKSLRLRSNELKLERQLENAQAEISSYGKKMSALEKDRQDLLSTIGALQEEKKLIQHKLLKASSGGKSISKTSDNKKNMSTSTDDLDTDNLRTIVPGGDTDTIGSQFSQENMHLGVHSAIPPDQTRMIQNINTLVAELALEKDQLTQALSEKSSQSSKLLELNKELTRKLEAQTQRLELLTSQNMANDIAEPRQVDTRAVHESTRYADEGDEVVERVLGWIINLFPGGPSRRRPSKHL